MSELSIAVRLLAGLAAAALMIAAVRSDDKQEEQTLVLWAIAVLLTSRL